MLHYSPIAATSPIAISRLFYYTISPLSGLYRPPEQKGHPHAKSVCVWLAYPAYGLACKANENFFRTTFFELCTRYLSRYFMFAIEVNRASGRSDWEAIGRAGTPFENQAAIIEFKHYPRETAARLGVADYRFFSL